MASQKTTPKKILEYRRAATKNNDRAAQFNLGVCYAKGLGEVTQDYEKAVEWYSKAAEQGDARAQFNLAECYKKGNGCNQDRSQAFQWFRKAALQGYVEAQFNLALCYAEGLGTKKNAKSAFAWYHKAATNNDVYAQNNLALCHFHGRGTPKNHKQAAIWFRKAANNGDSNAQFSLGQCYQKAEGVTQNHSEAIQWFRKAASQNHAEAQNTLGSYYYAGDHIAENHVKAFEWFSKSAEKNCKYAQYNLGVCYEKGHGVGENLLTALELYKKSAAQGYPQAKSALARLLKKSVATEEPAAPSTPPPKPAAKQKSPKKNPTPLSFGKITKPIRGSAPDSASAASASEAKISAPKTKLPPASIVEPSKKRKATELNGTGKKPTPTDRVTKSQTSPESSSSSSSAQAEETATARHPTTQHGEKRLVSITDKLFTPAIPTEGLDYSKIGFFKAANNKEQTRPPAQPFRAEKASGKEELTAKPMEEKTQLTDEAIIDIGRWGESCVYYKLKHHYLSKYQGRAEENEDGFTIYGRQDDADVTVQVTWHNKTKESYGNKDLSILKIKNGVEKQRYIEVKTTLRESSHIARFPESEWRAMLEYREKYSIYRVFNAGQTEGVRIEKIKDPLTKIISGEIGLDSMLLKI